MNARLFVALRPPADVRAELRFPMGGVADARWQSDAQLHLTLAFLGNTDRHQQQQVLQQLATISAPPLALRLGSIGSFAAGRSDRVSALFVGVDCTEAGDGRRHHDPLSRLAASIRQALRGLDLAIDERRFHPHITLARFGRAGAGRDSLRRWVSTTRIAPLPWLASEFFLMESRMGNEGSHYEPVARFPLAGPEAGPETGP